MAFVRSIKFTIPGKNNKPSLEVYAEEKGGELVFTVTVKDPQAKIADLRGLFFDLNTDSKLAGLATRGGGGLITELATGNVMDLGNGANMHGAASPFDVGIEFGSAGAAKNVVNGPLTFTLTNTAKNLTLDDIANVDFGARLTSGGGAKLTMVSPAAPDAKTDAPVIFEDNAKSFTDPKAATSGALIKVLANDTDADGDKLTITAVTQGAHGTVTIVDGPDADKLIGDAILYTPDTDYAGTDTFTYAISDGRGGTDFATVNMTVRAVADIPNVDVRVSAGSAVNKVLVTVTATQTDNDGSEYIDRIELSGLPAGVTASPASVNPTTKPGVLTHTFELTLPTNADTDFDLKVTAVSKETSNNDEQTGVQTVDIVLNQTRTLQTVTFEATDQSIWSTGDQFTFTDDRFIGFDKSWEEGFDGFIAAGTNGSIKAGLQSTLVFEGGEIDASAVFDLTIDTLYNKTTDVLLFTADSVLKDLDFTTEGPDGSYALDLIFEFMASVYGSVGGIEIFNESTGQLKLRENLFTLTSDELEYEQDLGAGFSITFAWPTVDSTSGPLFGGTANATGTSNNFLELGLDVDDLIFTLAKLPNPLGIDFNYLAPVVGGTADIVDLDLSAGLNFIQNFALTINSLAGLLTWEDGSSQAFSFDTDIQLLNASSKDANRDGSIGYTLTLTPNADLLNDTELGINFGYEFGVLKFSGYYNILVDEGTFEKGPVFGVDDTFELGSIDLYSTEFAVNFGSENVFGIA